MVKNMNLKNQTIYQVYVRNHTKEGTFKALMSDLDRIKQLGADIVHFLPIHPIGVKNRKGTLGSPYSISDYRAINPEYGTLGDFRLLVDAMHEKGLKVMIDVVYNHTSHDSVLIEKFPTSYLRNAAGETIPKVADWWDIADLIHNSEALQQELIDTLVYWTQMGVDGFRCDVASIVPLTFWRAADAAVRAVNPDVIWLAETIDPHFTADMKRQGVLYETDSDMYEVFDIQYAYDVWHIQREYYLGNRTLARIR
jgi:cyclomaltodextrinase / maltogenic alpha-amylase / neopullulanase